MSKIVRFDDSLPTLVSALADVFGKEAFSHLYIIRDASGRLSAVSSETLDSKIISKANAAIERQLGKYARSDDAFRDASSPGVSNLVNEGRRSPTATVGGVAVRVLDRRIVGPDWLRSPTQSSGIIPRITFASLKGGVGRSTALCVMASHLSRRGRRVLAIDFDLEAPGIGTMLLTERQLPQYGALDYLVENGISGIDDRFFSDMSGDSTLGSDGARVTVVPAIGQRTIENPADALAKISRAYLDDIKEDRPPATLTDQLSEMIYRFEETGAYDVVLIDARAGMHETTAAPILGLGADVLFFGLDLPQTFLGYRLLLAHMARFTPNPEDDWRERLHFVHAKASASSSLQRGAIERFRGLYEIIAPQTPDLQTSDEKLTAKDFDIAWKMESEAGTPPNEFVPPEILRVLDDGRYRDFDPVTDRALLASETYSSTFDNLLKFADSLIDYTGSMTE